MNNMFKKTLVAAALAGMSATAFADVSTSPVFVSSEYKNVVDGTEFNSVRANEFGYTFQHELTAGDIVEITFSKLPQTGLGAFGTRTFTGTADLKAFTLGVISRDPGTRTIRYRVTNIDDAANIDKTTIGATVNFGQGMRFSVADLDAQVTMRVLAGESELEGSRDSASLFRTNSQYAWNAATSTGVRFVLDTDASREISVYDDRQSFGVFGGSDTVRATWSAQGAGDGAFANHGGDVVNSPEGDFYYAMTRYARHVVSGEFGWLAAWHATPNGLWSDFLTVTCDNDQDHFAGLRPDNAEAVSVSASSVSFNCWGLGSPSIELDMGGAIAAGAINFLPETTFSVNSSVQYNLHRGNAYRVNGTAGVVNNGQMFNFAPVPLGEWRIEDGTNVTIPYLPLDRELDIRVSLNADIAFPSWARQGWLNIVDHRAVPVRDADNGYGYGDVFVLVNGTHYLPLDVNVAQGVTNIGPQLTALLAGLDLESDGAHVQLFFLAADRDVQVHSAYVGADGDTVPVHNDSIEVRQVLGYDDFTMNR